MVFGKTSVKELFMLIFPTSPQFMDITTLDKMGRIHVVGLMVVEVICSAN